MLVKENAMLDLLIKGATVVTPMGAGSWDVGVQGEKIAAVALAGTLPQASRTIDATGKIVVPGGIEAHAHAGIRHISKRMNNLLTAGPAELSLFALWGGTTTIVDFARMYEPKTDMVKAMYEENLNEYAGNSYIDYSAHCIYYGASATIECMDQIKDLIAAGFPSMKIFMMGGNRPGMPLTRIDAPRMLEIMKQTAKHGGIVAVHAEDQEVLDWNYAKAEREEKTHWSHFPEVRDNFSEDLSINRAIKAAEHAGSAMYVVHMSAREGVDAIAQARSRGLPVYGETILLYASFNSEDYKKPDGMIYHTYPSTKAEVDRRRLWDGLLHKDMSILATDAIGTTYADKTKGKTISNVQGGNNGIEVRMGVAYSEGVVNQGMTLERYVAVTSSNPARILGLYPRKGAIAPGSDADLVIIDPSIRRVLKAKDLHSYDYTPWEGRDVQGWPTVVTLRGKVMIEGGKLLGQPSDGRLIFRKIDSSVLSRPVV